MDLTAYDHLCGILLYVNKRISLLSFQLLWISYRLLYYPYLISCHFSTVPTFKATEHITTKNVLSNEMPRKEAEWNNSSRSEEKLFCGYWYLKYTTKNYWRYILQTTTVIKSEQYFTLFSFAIALNCNWLTKSRFASSYSKLVLYSTNENSRSKTDLTENIFLL